MKQFNLLSVIFLLFATGLSSERSSQEPLMTPKLRYIEEAIEQEFEMTKDPALNVVPRERLKAAKAYADRLRNSPSYQRSAIAGINWEERGPNNVSGRTRAILVDLNDPTYNTLWAGGVGGGLWKTTNAKAGTPTWTNVGDMFGNLAVSTLAQDPSNPNNLYMGTGEGWFNADAIRGLGIWKSTDGGTNWAQLSSTNNSTFHYVQKMVVDGNGNVFACTRTGGLQKSTNGGASWTKILGSGVGSTSNFSADIEIAANGDLYVTMGGLWDEDGIYKSTNGGTSWTKLSGGLPTSGYYRIELACAPSDANRVYALYCATNYNCYGIYRTDNAGGSWTSLPVPSAYGMSNFCRGQAWYDLICGVDPNNSSRVFIGGIDMLVSTNAGSSWSQKTQWYGGGGYQYMHADQHAIVFEPGNSNVIYFGNDGGVFRTTNGSVTTPTISFISNGYNVTQFYAGDIHPGAGVNTFIAGAQDNGTQYFTTSGMNNTVEVTGGDGAFCHIDQDQPNIQISSYVYNQYRVTTNSWASYTTVNYSSSNGRFINPTDYDDAANILYGAYSGGAYYYMLNVGSGNNSGARTIAAFNGSQVSCVRVSPNVSNRVYFGLSNGNVVRVDNAHSSSAVGTVIRSGSGYVHCVEIEAGNEDHLLVAYSNYGVNSIFESTNGGGSWTSVEGNLPDMPVRWAMFYPGDANQALLGTELGVWSTDDLNGTSTVWGPSSSGLANTRVSMLKARADNTVMAATHGRGVFTTVLSLGPPPLNVTVVSSSNVSCNGGSDGSATAQAANGTTPYTYSWAGPNGFTAATASISGLAAGTYIVTVTDGNNDQASDQVEITEPTALATAVTGTDESAPGANDGTANLTVTGGTPPYTYAWTGPNGFTATTEDLSGLGPGTYNVTVTDANNCIATDAVSIGTIIPVLSVTVTSSTDVSCNGGNDGSATAQAANGIPPYTYSWSNGATGATATNLAAGTYTVTVTDANLDQATDQVSIGEPVVLSTSIAKTDESAAGAGDGSANLTVSGGISPYTYAWTGPNGFTASTEDIGNLFAGTYDVTVTDANGCTATDQTTIDAPTNVVLAFQVAASNDDAEEGRRGAMSLTDASLELVKDNKVGQNVGIRFQGLSIPASATINSAYIQFTATGGPNGNGSITIAGHNTGNSPAFSSSSGDISGRALTAASVGWSPNDWNTTGEAGADQQTSDLSTIVQEIVNRGDWSNGNAISFIFSGSATRTAYSYDGNATSAPILVVDYTVSGNTNVPPAVDITSPADGATFNTLDPIAISANASDADGTVSQVEFLVDGVSVGVSTTSPYGVSWTPPGDGAYTLTSKATDDDGATSESLPVGISVSTGTAMNTTGNIAAGSDDAEEDKRGNMSLSDADLELVKQSNQSGNQQIGLRFTGFTLPQGATITSAYIQFTASSSNNANGSMNIYGHAADNSATFTTAGDNISSRALTTATVGWGPNNWAAGASGADQQTPDLSAVVQEIVSRPSWNGNAITIIIQGSGTRVAAAFENGTYASAVLHIDYIASNGPGQGTVPVVGEGLNPALRFKVYPNPMEDWATVEIEAPERDSDEALPYQLRMYDMSGKVVLSREVPLYSGETKVVQFPVKSLSEGMYLLEMSDSQQNRIGVKKLIKK